MASEKGATDNNPPPSDFKTDNANPDGKSFEEETTTPEIHTTPASPTEASSEEAEESKGVAGSRLVIPGEEERNNTNDGSQTAVKKGFGGRDYDTFETPPENFNLYAPAPLGNFRRPFIDANDNSSESSTSNPDVKDVENLPSAAPSPGTTAQNPAPALATLAGRPHPWFVSPDDIAGAGLYNESTDPADACVTMTVEGGTSTGTPATLLRPHRDTSLAEQLAQIEAEEEAARQDAPPVISKKAPEISAFEAYVKKNANEECAKLGLAALQAVNKQEAKVRIEILTLVNANRELSEKYEVQQKDILRFAADAARQRTVGQYSQEDLERAYHDHKNVREAAEKKRDQLQKDFDNLKKWSIGLENNSKAMLLKARSERQDAQDKSAKLEEEVRRLKSGTELISKADCDTINAEYMRQREQAVRDLETLQNRFDDVLHDTEKTDQIRRSLHERIAELEGENDDLKVQVAAYARDTIESLETQLAAVNENKTDLLTEDETNKRHADEKLRLESRIEDLESQLGAATRNNAQLLAGNDNLKKQATENAADKDRLNAKIKDLEEEIATLEAALSASGTKIEENGDEVRAENEKLKKQVGARADQLLNVSEVNRQQEDEINNLEGQIAVCLENADEGLRQINQKLRAQIDPLKEKLAEAKNDIRDLKDQLKYLDGGRGGLGGLKKPEDPKMTKLKEENENYKKKEGQYEKQFTAAENRYLSALAIANSENDSLKHRLATAAAEIDRRKKALETAKAKVDSLKRELQTARTVNQPSEADRQNIEKLEALIEEKAATIADNQRSGDEMKKHLEAQIQALHAVKADRERQIEILKKKIAEKKNGETGTGGPDNPEPRSPTRSDGKASDMAMEVALLRVELALGQLQAERKRNGYTEGDVDVAISIAGEAQVIAETLNTSAWLGRAAYWRGITEWMGGNSTASQSYFETSDSYDWTEPQHERDMLPEWWFASKTQHVDKTSQRHPNVPNLSSWSTRSKKNKKSANKQKHKDKTVASKDKGGKKRKGTKIKRSKMQTQ